MAVTVAAANIFALLHIRPIQQEPWVAEIRSQATGLFLCMNRKGILYSSCNRSTECEFLGDLEATYYDTFRSVQFADRYIAIATDGRVKKARRVREPKGRLGKEHFFLPRQLALKDVHRIISQHQQNLPENETPQRCAGFADSYTTQRPVMTESNTLPVNAAEVEVPIKSATNTTTTSTSRPPRQCKVINGRRRCKRRKRPCKSKRCRTRRRKERVKNKKSKESSGERRVKNKESKESSGERKRNKGSKRKKLRKSTNERKSENIDKVVGETEIKKVENEAKDSVSVIRHGDSVVNTSESETNANNRKYSHKSSEKTKTDEITGSRRHEGRRISEKTKTDEITGSRRHEGRRRKSRMRGKLRGERQGHLMAASPTERRVRHEAQRRLLFHQTSIATTTPLPKPAPTSPVPTYINVVLSRPTAGTNSIFKVEPVAPRPFPSAPSSAVPRRRQQRMRHKGLHLSQRRRPRGRIIVPTSSSF
ncbi:unnamed protein product, partial [Meganyctiphanes norvegica]